MNTRSGIVAIMGPPNVGKSTFLNALMQKKVSIVACKPHTTRWPVRAIRCEDTTQVVFVDTPGLTNTPHNLWHKRLIHYAWSAIDGVDHVIVMADERYGNDFWQVMQRVQQLPSYSVVLNKSDTMSTEQKFTFVNKIKEAGYNDTVWVISAKWNKGVDDVWQDLQARMPQAPWLFSQDDQTDHRAWHAAECVREKALHALQDEVPYNIWIHPTQFSWGNSWRCTVTIVVPYERYRPLILGTAGHRIKSIGMAARAELCATWARHGQLFLRVAVDPAWTRRQDVNHHMRQGSTYFQLPPDTTAKE